MQEVDTVTVFSKRKYRVGLIGVQQLGGRENHVHSTAYTIAFLCYPRKKATMPWVGWANLQCRQIYNARASLQWCQSPNTLIDSYLLPLKHTPAPEARGLATPGKHDEGWCVPRWTNFFRGKASIIPLTKHRGSTAI